VILIYINRVANTKNNNPIIGLSIILQKAITFLVNPNIEPIVNPIANEIST